jgi:hypothetical protein
MAKWYRRKPSKHGDLIVIAFLTFFIGAMAFLVVIAQPVRDGRQRFNFGMPTDFQCSPAGLDPTAACIKKPSPFPSR